MRRPPGGTPRKHPTGKPTATLRNFVSNVPRAADAGRTAARRTRRWIWIVEECTHFRHETIAVMEAAIEAFSAVKGSKAGAAASNGTLREKPRKHPTKSLPLRPVSGHS